MNTNVSTLYRSKPARADSEVDIGLAASDGCKRILKVSTYKSDGKVVVTYARVCAVDGNFVRYLIGADFHRRVRWTALTATDRNVRAEHVAALSGIAELIDAARAHYGHAETATPATTPQNQAA